MPQQSNDLRGYPLTAWQLGRERLPRASRAPAFKDVESSLGPARHSGSTANISPANACKRWMLSSHVRDRDTNWPCFTAQAARLEQAAP